MLIATLHRRTHVPLWGRHACRDGINASTASARQSDLPVMSRCPFPRDGLFLLPTREAVSPCFPQT